MARLWTSGFESNSTTANVEWTALGGGAETIQTTTVRSGTYALQNSGLSSGNVSGLCYQYASAIAKGPYFFRIYFRYHTLPSASNTVIAIGTNTAFTLAFGLVVKLNTDGSLGFYNRVSSVDSQIGSNSSALSADTWYRVELKYDATAASGSETATALIDGTQFATSSSLGLNTGSGFDSLNVGGNLEAETQTTGNWYFDDIAINDSTGASQTTYPGAGNVIRLFPDSAGDANTFATQTGGTAGAANNFTRVDENPPDDATSFNGSSTLNQTDMFNAGASGVGSGSTVSVVSVGGRLRNSTADTAETIKFQIEKTAAGTKTQSVAIIPNTTLWVTNSTAAPHNPAITTYADPDGSAWTSTTLDSMQIGYILTVVGTGSRRIDVSAVWADVDYFVADLSVNVNDTATATESLIELKTSFYSGSDSLTTSESLTHFSDQADTMEAIKMLVDLGPNVSTNVTITENKVLDIPININVSDPSTVSENVNLHDDTISVSDTSLITENVGVLISPVVQGASGTSTSSSVAATLTSTPTQGNIMVAVVMANVAQSAVSISGWNAVAQSGFTSFSGGMFFKNAGASESTTVTASATAATIMEIQVYEYSFSYNSLDQTASVDDSGVSVTQRSSGTTGTTNTTNELAVAAIVSNGNQGDSALWSGIFTGRSVTPRILVADKILNTTGTFETHPTWANSVKAAGLIATFNSSTQVSVSDSSTITENIQPLETSFISLEDDSTIDDEPQIFLLSITVADNLVASESVAMFADENIALSENVTTTELPIVQIFVSSFGESVSDNLTTAESLSHYSDEMQILESVALTLTDFPKISDFDLLTISESQRTYSDQMDVGEAVSLQIITISVIAIGDTINYSENIALNMDKQISTSDSSTISESVDIVRGGSRDIAIVDNRLLDESGGFILDENGNYITDENPSELSIISDPVQMLIITDNFVTVSDNITLSEGLLVSNPFQDLRIGILDSLAISENINLALNPELLSASDSMTVSESYTVQLQAPAFYTVSILENSAISENLIISLLMKFITVNDSMTIAEVSSVVISTANISAFDTLSTAESIGVKIDPKAIIVGDSLSTSEGLLVQLSSVAAGNVTSFDNTTIGESLSVIIDPKKISISDSLTTSEGVLVIEGVLPTNNLSFLEASQISENVSLALTPLMIRVSDSSPLSDLLTMVGPFNGIAADSSTINESITVKTNKPVSNELDITFVLPTDLDFSLVHNPSIAIDFAQPISLAFTLILPAAIDFTVLAHDENQ